MTRCADCKHFVRNEESMNHMGMCGITLPPMLRLEDPTLSVRFDDGCDLGQPEDNQQPKEPT